MKSFTNLETHGKSLADNYFIITHIYFMLGTNQMVIGCCVQGCTLVVHGVQEVTC